MLPAGAASSDVVDVSMAELSGNKRGDAGPRVDGASSKRRRPNDGGEQPVAPESADGTDTLERGPKTPRLESPAQQTMNLVTCDQHRPHSVKFYCAEEDLGQLHRDG